MTSEPRQGDSALIAFAVTNFQGHWPVGTAAIVIAREREHCKRVLREELRKEGLGHDDPDHWTIEPITPLPDGYSAQPSARVLLNGEY